MDVTDKDDDGRVLADFAAKQGGSFELLLNNAGVAFLGDFEAHTPLAEALADSIADGSINPQLDPLLAATALWAAMNGILAPNWPPDRQPHDDPRTSDLIATWIATATRGLFTNRS